MISILTYRGSKILCILKDYLRSKLTIVGVVSPSPVKINVYVYMYFCYIESELYIEIQISMNWIICYNS